MRLLVLVLFISWSYGLWAQSSADHTVTYILIDGLSSEVFESELAKDNLPNLSKLIEGGTYVKQGLGSFPSMTGYAYYPFLTGRKAIESNILGLRWFDRSLEKGNLRNYVGRSNVWMNQDINPDIKTIFEYFPYDYTTSINAILNRGVQDSEITSWPFTVAKFESHPLFKFIKKLPLVGGKRSYDHFKHEKMVMDKAIDQLSRNPKVQWITFGGLDAMHHINGMNDDYVFLLHHVDHLIGEFVAAVDSFHQTDQRMIAIISDHGVSDVDTNQHVPYYLDSITNIRLRRSASTQLRMSLDAPLSSYDDVDGQYVVNGNLTGLIYLKKPTATDRSGWKNNLSYFDLVHYQGQQGEGNILEALIGLEGISFISYCRGDSVCVKNANGLGTITKVENRIKYTVVDNDPLEYPSDLYDTLLTEATWLEKTIDLKYPFGPVRLYDFMTHPNMGDILLCSKRGYDLAADYEILVDNYKGGHGDLRRDLTVVPYIIFTPGKSPEKKAYATSQDIGQWVFRWMGVD